MKMKWQNRKRFRDRERVRIRERLVSRMICLVTASVLAVGCIIAVPVFGGTAQAAPAVDLDQACKLQVKIAETGEEAEMPDVVIDLYKVADAVPVDGYDTYSFENLEGFSDLDFNIISEEKESHEADYEEIWKPLAQEAAARIFASDSIVPVVQGGAPNANLYPEGAAGLSSGLYLVVARGNGMERDEYVVRGTEAQEEEIVTIAHSDSYTFTYSPQLVALPTKEGADGSIATSNPGQWQYELEMEPKFGLSERFAALAIEKVLESYVTGNPATFVFSVEAVMPGADGGQPRVVYSDVVSMTFNGAGRQSVLLAAEFGDEDADSYSQLKTARIPVGAQVTVTEVYSGVAYRPADGMTVRTVDGLGGTKPGEEGFADANTFSFRNEYDGTGRRGSAITNHFEYESDGAGLVWNLTQIPSIAQAPGVTD